jgi:hypothetical protein
VRSTRIRAWWAAIDTKLSVALDYLGLLGRPAGQARFDYCLNQQSNDQVDRAKIVASDDRQGANVGEFESFDLDGGQESMPKRSRL